jgi:hypothetical protein
MKTMNAKTRKTETPVITLNEENIGTSATSQDAEKLIEALREIGYNVQYGPSNDEEIDENGGLELDAITDADWDIALEKILP